MVALGVTQSQFCAAVALLTSTSSCLPDHRDACDKHREPLLAPLVTPQRTSYKDYCIFLPFSASVLPGSSPGDFTASLCMLARNSIRCRQSTLQCQRGPSCSSQQRGRLATLCMCARPPCCSASLLLQVFWIPIFRHLFYWLGGRPAGKDTMRKLLREVRRCFCLGLGRLAQPQHACSRHSPSRCIAHSLKLYQRWCCESSGDGPKGPEWAEAQIHSSGSEDTCV